MDVSYPAALNAEEMAVWHRFVRDPPVQAGKAQEDGHGAQLLVNHIAPVGYLDGRWQPEAAGVLAGGPGVGVGAALKSCTGCPKGDDNARVGEAVEVGVARGLDDGPTIALVCRDGVPVLERVPELCVSVDPQNKNRGRCPEDT